ncbi:TPA: hypothetical protein IX023_001113 [Enterococcus faecium]|nr:hypothetical protein [Enterococcus faecium]
MKKFIANEYDFKGRITRIVKVSSIDSIEKLVSDYKKELVESYDFHPNQIEDKLLYNTRYVQIKDFKGATSLVIVPIETLD